MHKENYPISHFYQKDEHKMRLDNFLYAYGSAAMQILAHFVSRMHHLFLLFTEC